MRPHLTMEQRLLALRLSAKGMSLREVGRQVDCFHQLVRSLVARDSKRPVRTDSWEPGAWAQSGRPVRDQFGLRAGASFTAIAARIGKATAPPRPGWYADRSGGCASAGQRH